MMNQKRLPCELASCTKGAGAKREMAAEKELLGPKERFGLGENAMHVVGRCY